MRGTRFNWQEIQKLKDNAANMTNQQLADMLGRDKSSVSKKLKELNIKPKQDSRTRNADYKRQRPYDSEIITEDVGAWRFFDYKALTKAVR